MLRIKIEACPTEIGHLGDEQKGVPKSRIDRGGWWTPELQAGCWAHLAHTV